MACSAARLRACGPRRLRGTKAVRAAALVSQAEPQVWSDAAVAERVGAFRDFGVPAVRGKSPVDEAAIADGACRAVGAADPNDAFFAWHRAAGRVPRVLDAIEALPPPAPDVKAFAEAARATLPGACRTPSEENGFEAFPPADVEGAVAKWTAALCPGGGATEPQQRAATVAYVCLATCDARGLSPDPARLAELASSKATADAAAKATCDKAPPCGCR